MIGCRSAARLVVLAAMMTAGFAVASAESESVVEPAKGPRWHRARLKLDVTGEVFAPAGRDVPPVRQPIAVDARFDFVEGIAAGGDTQRIYRDAAADLRIDGTTRAVRLADSARSLRVALRGTTPMPYLTWAFLCREELDLLETPFDPLLLGRLIPVGPVKVGDSWAVAPDAVAGLLAIDTVESGSLDATIDELADGRATVRLAGIVDGAADGVPTHVTVEGSFSAETRAGDGGVHLGPEVSIVAVTLRERREASHVAPGFDVEARLTLAREATAEPAAIDENAAAAAGTDRRRGEGGPGLVWHRDAAGRYDLVHDAGWRVIEDGPDGLVMRRIDHGVLLAQCSVTALPRTAAQTPPTIAEVERDLQRSLGSQFGRLEHSSEAARSNGIRVVRVAATGRADGRDFRWIHQVLTDADGHRLAVTCTLEESLAARFGTADRELVDGVLFGSTGVGGGDPQAEGGDAGDRQARLPQESRMP